MLEPPCAESATSALKSLYSSKLRDNLLPVSLSVMTETNYFDDLAILPRTLGQSDDSIEPERRQLIVMRTTTRLLGVFADEADSVADGLAPTPLPRAPASVLGVVSVRGRILTVIDPLVLLNEERNAPCPPRFIVALRGDEQLALAVERVERIIEIPTDAIAPLGNAVNIVRGVVQSEGDLVVVLDPAKLFDVAMQDTERRRQRT